MTLNRALATAVVAAVTTPVVLVAGTPALAQGVSAPQAEIRQSGSGDASLVSYDESLPTYEDLQKAAVAAKKAYDDAVVAEREGRKVLEATLNELDSESHPLNSAWREAEKAADDAADAKAAADQDVTDAKAALDAAESEADKAEAQEALDAAETALAEAVEALEAARGKAKAARTELDDARVAATRAYHLVKKALTEARAAKEAADKALAEARECVRDEALTSRAVGLPSKVVAGETVDFTFRIANGGTRTLSVDPLTGVHLKNGRDEALKVEWSDGSGWHALDAGNGAEHLGRVDELKPGERSDLRMRLTVDAKAVGKGGENIDGFALFAADAFDAYKPCVLGPMKRYDFEVLPAGSKPGEVDDAKPGKPGSGDDERPEPGEPGADGADGGKGSGTSAQGGAGASAGDESAERAKGDLAETGASSASLPLALAGVGAVALGAGAVLVVRRSKAAEAN